MLVASQSFAAPKALFDNAHAETAGNADWVIDNDQPVPSPAQSGIGANTAGTFWTGAISSWGVDLVKRGYTVHTSTSALTYGNAGNTYDLSNYDVPHRRRAQHALHGGRGHGDLQLPRERWRARRDLGSLRLRSQQRRPGFTADLERVRPGPPARRALRGGAGEANNNIVQTFN